MRLLLLLQAAAALNVSVVPAYFRSPKERNFFRRYGKWQIDERRCDRFIRNRAYDKTCQRLDPKPYELLPLLVTGAPGSGTRAVFELVYAMCHKATRECRQYPEFNTSLDAAVVLQPHGSPKPPEGTPPIIFENPCCEVCHEGYGDMATVSSVHAVNEQTMGVPYPYTDERSGWWLKRQIVDKYGYANAFTPRFRRVVHLAIENDINLMLNGRYGTLTSMLGNFDAHLPVLMRGSRFVFSPNGVGEQCYREYEALVAGTYPLVDASSNKHRNAILDLLPVVRVDDWATVTPSFLRAKGRELDGKDYDVSILYLPYWYDLLLTALELA